MTETEYYVADAGYQIAYGDNHAKDRPALIFLHGWAGQRSLWLQQIQYFSPDYRVISIDLPGHGDSSCGGHTGKIEQFADDLAKVTEALNLQTVYLVGHSMAGRIIACAAATRLSGRVSGVCGAETYWDISGGAASAASEDFIENLYENFDATTQNYIESMFVAGQTNSAVREAVFQAFQRADQRILQESLTDALRGNDQLLGWLKHIDCPKATINSMNWRSTNLESAHRVGLGVKTISGTGHYIMLEKANDFNAQLEVILSDWNSRLGIR